jgi:hypothetical protein
MRSADMLLLAAVATGAVIRPSTSAAAPFLLEESPVDLRRLAREDLVFAPISGYPSSRLAAIGCLRSHAAKCPRLWTTERAHGADHSTPTFHSLWITVRLHAQPRDCSGRTTSSAAQLPARDELSVE